MKPFLLYTFNFLLLTLVSCATMTPEQWRQLPDKTFYFDRFIYSKGYMKNRKAFNFMKETQTEKIFQSLEASFGIRINRDAYQDFLSNEELSLIKREGFPVKDTYTWQVTSPNKNSIRLLREEEVIEDGMVAYRYKLEIISKGQVLKKFEGEEEEEWETMKQLLKEIKKAKLPGAAAPAGMDYI